MTSTKRRYHQPLDGEELSNIYEEVCGLAAPVSKARQNELHEAVWHLKEIIQKELGCDAEVYLIGSTHANINVADSDLDFTVFCDPLERWERYYLRKSNPRDDEKTLKQKVAAECLKKLLKGISNAYDRGYKVYNNPRVIESAQVPVLTTYNRTAGVNIDISWAGIDALRNSKFLLWNTLLDHRFAPLCRAIKTWAKVNEVTGAQDGKINSLSMSFLVMNYLQDEIFKPVLPSLQYNFPELLVEFDNPRRNYNLEGYKPTWKSENTMCLGGLFAGFFQYISNFDFLRCKINVKLGEGILRKEGELFESNRKVMRYDPMAILDPFKGNDDFNISATARFRGYQYIMKRFKNQVEIMKKRRSIFAIKITFVGSSWCECWTDPILNISECQNSIIVAQGHIKMRRGERCSCSTCLRLRRVSMSNGNNFLKAV